MGRNIKILVFSLLTIFLLSSCAILYPSIARAKKDYEKSLGLRNKIKRTAAYENILGSLNEKINNGIKAKDAYIVYINSLYQLALINPEKRKVFYNRAAIVSAVFVKKFKYSGISHYYFAKSLYLTENNNREIIEKIIFHAHKANNLFSQKGFSLERKELKKIIQDIENAISN
ncbi:hypothetical protein J7L48_04315 [bacterium]|nr:hypothetical protein [bacterium]